MASRQTLPGINTNINRNLVSGQMQAANMQSPWRAPDIGSTIAGATKVAAQYYEAEKDAAFKRLDLEADKLQDQELEEIRVATSNEQIPEIENNFKMRLNEAFSQDSWGQKWLKERSELYFAANSRDVMQHGLAKQHELYTLELDKALNAWANDISTSAPDKARALIGDADRYIDNSDLLSPAEKQKTKANFLDLALEGMATGNPDGALLFLKDPNTIETLGRAKAGKYMNLAQAQKQENFKNTFNIMVSDFMADPTPQKLEDIKAFNPEIKERTLTRLNDIMVSSPNYVSYNTYEGIEDFSSELMDFSNSEFANENEAFEKAVELAERVSRSNKSGKLSAEESKDAQNKIMQVLKDESVRNAFSMIKPTFDSCVSDVARMVFASPTYSRMKKASKMREMATNGMINALNAAAAGDVEGAKQIYQQTRKSLVYYANPEIEGKSVGDKITVNGQVYELTGIDSDAIVKVVR